MEEGGAKGFSHQVLISIYLVANFCSFHSQSVQIELLQRAARNSVVI